MNFSKPGLTAAIAVICLAALAQLSDASQLRAKRRASAPPPASRSVADRLRDLEYPELRKNRDPREIQILKTLVAARKATYEMAEARFQVGAHSLAEVVEARYGLFGARARLAWAEHRVRDAFQSTVEAAHEADRMVEVRTIEWQQGMLRMREVLYAQVQRAEAQLALIRAHHLAEVAGVDVGDVEFPKFDAENPIGRPRDRDTELRPPRIELLQPPPIPLPPPD